MCKFFCDSDLIKIAHTRDNGYNSKVIRITCNNGIANFISRMNKRFFCRCGIDDEGFNLIKFKCSIKDESRK